MRRNNDASHVLSQPKQAHLTVKHTLNEAVPKKRKLAKFDRYKKIKNQNRGQKNDRYKTILLFLVLFIDFFQCLLCRCT